MKRSSHDEPHFKKIQIASLRLRWRTTGERAGTAGKGWDYIVATVGKQPLADAMMAMMNASGHCRGLDAADCEYEPERLDRSTNWGRAGNKC